ncbi:MAG: hypothetical protein LBI69_01650 [Puniceicoccales bacterium]|nr:hypothetical protein [Puniceicoccales bacterium]
MSDATEAFSVKIFYLIFRNALGLLLRGGYEDAGIGFFFFYAHRPKRHPPIAIGRWPMWE